MEMGERIVAMSAFCLWVILVFTGIGFKPANPNGLEPIYLVVAGTTFLCKYKRKQFLINLDP